MADDNLGGRLLATTSGADGMETQFHHPDRLGTRLVTGVGGAVVTEQLGMPFGTMLPFTQTYGGENSYQHPTLSNPSKKRFTSYDRSDVTGLDYAVNRHYSSAQGRFTQVDPIGMGAASLDNPQTLNMYAYCGNDPINRDDRNGLFWGAIGRFFKAIGIAIATFFGSRLGGYSGPGFRTPPTFPGSLPGITAARRSGMGGFRTPPFVSGFLHTSSIAIWGDGVGAVGTFLQMILAQGRRGKLSAKQKAAQEKAARDKALESGKKAAEARLNNDACAKLFGGKANALRVLNSATIKYADLEKGTYTQKAGGGFTATRLDGDWNGEPNTIRINTNGGFIGGGVYDAYDKFGVKRTLPPSGFPGMKEGYYLEGDDYRAFVLLHELGHATADVSTFEHDGGGFATDESRRNNDKLYEACFKQ